VAGRWQDALFANGNLNHKPLKRCLHPSLPKEAIAVVAETEPFAVSVGSVHKVINIDKGNCQTSSGKSLFYFLF
jgi:hypothetical protein